jgi:anaerobic magnesium-protoporphyrin IX monomethyl ester cyclase
MYRILLINPPSPEQLGSPLLGQQYVAAAFLAQGAEVRVIDAAARGYDGDPDAIMAEAAEFAPDLIGVGLYTRWVWHAYRLVARLRALPALLVAGGPHATVRGPEVLAHGFDLVIAGEAERSAAALVDLLAGRIGPEAIPGALFRERDGTIRQGAPGAYVDQLDVIAPPHLAQPLYRASWYRAGAEAVVPGGLLTSRGCPARCTFCANYVTGRGFRFHSAERVVSEIMAAHQASGLQFFPFWDDALTADRRRLGALCSALERDIPFPLRWSAITRASFVTRELLATMQQAGLMAVNFGVETGDDEILRAIRKGITTDQVVRALEWARELGLITTCNFMLGFPMETPAALGRTLRFMERIEPLVDNFSTMGVVVPFPGTPIYEDYHQRYGFTDWWLRADYSRFTPPPPVEERGRYHRYYIDDGNLELDFFDYEPAMREMIRECLRFKAEHNLKNLGLWDGVQPAAAALQ